jgi:3-hydroxy acid dehydrogenase/malonic semialdehyde reductase
VQQGGTVATVQLDVSDRAQVATLWSKVPPDLRNIDILGTYSHLRPRYDHFGLPPRLTSSAVNNAGSAHGTDHVGDILDSDIDAMFATNVLGLISVTQLLVKGPSYSLGKPPARRAQLTHIYPTDFKARNTGHVINIGSIAGRESYPGGGVYCATKAAVRAFTGSLLREVVNTPIRVTEIQPGPCYSRLSCLYLRTHHRNGGDRVFHRTLPWRQVRGGQGVRWPAAMCVMLSCPTLRAAPR